MRSSLDGVTEYNLPSAGAMAADQINAIHWVKP
jgi:hypothetical protein